ncbi:MAG: PAS domain S-box protein [Deltaproteobacteria bacterium]|nr:PAS domain S-box protein [Deltaproteobacteria bacterium]
MNTGPGNKYKLEDLIDIKHFQDLQDRLYKIYPFASAVIDNDGNILTATAWQDICTNFHRKNRECEKACIQSDKYILEHLDEANPSITYHCPHGLVDNAIPILIDGIHYGNFFTGQFFMEKPDMAFFKNQAGRYGFSEELYLDAVKKVPICSREQLESFLTFFKGLVDIVSEIGAKNLIETKTRKQIQEGEKRYHSIINTAMDGFWLVDKHGNLMEVNDTYCKMSGYSRKELLSKSVPDIEVAASQDEIENNVKNVIKKGGGRFIGTHRRKDGSHFKVEISIQFQPEDDGSFICFLQDITDRIKAEEALKRSEEKHRTILQTAIDGFMIIDKTGEIIEVNDSYSKMSGYSREELLNKNAAMLEAVYPSEEMIKEINEIVDRKTYRFIRQHKRKDGSLFDVEISSQYQAEEENFVCFIRDITEKKEMESLLKQAQKMESIGTLAGGIAHDFNNILSPIMMNAEMAMIDLQPDDPLQECMKEIFHSSERARDLVKQILTFARKRSEKRILLKASEIVKDAVKFLRSTIPTTININYSNRAKRDTILADPTQLNQIIMNLCTNAAYAMREKGGLLEVTSDNVDISKSIAKRYYALNPGSYFRLSVTDNGTGISPDIMERIFDPYFTTKKAGEGSGLGLAIVHGIVKNYGGDITVENKLGHGATFNVYLPLTDAKVTGEVNINREDIPKGTERILLVDDEEVAVYVSHRMLEKYGYTVTSTTRSMEALKIFKNNPCGFDLVITDMAMPNMTGETLAKEIMAIRPEMPVILCTGFSDNINEEKAKKLGIRCFVLKPIIMSELVKTIRQALKNDRL